ncbi:MAG: hypothetical protein JXR51_09640 [Bacteroidales bacterium]|nr:hypothetical protein [Bacteroidales bacterium]
MITQKGAEFYAWSVKDTAVKITSYYARVQGEITTYGNKIIQYGHCWSLSENPLVGVDTLMTIFNTTDFDTTATKSVSYESRMSSLLASKDYYVRSYIITGGEGNNPVDTGYNVVNLKISTPDPINVWYEQTGGGRPSARYDAVCFNKGDTVYFGTGNQRYIGASTAYLTKDFWQYDPVEDAWAQLTAFPTGAYEGITNAVGFALTFYYAPTEKYVNRLYMGLGDFIGDDSYTHKTNHFWEYNLETNTWKSVENFQGLPTTESASFAIKDKAYVGTGSYNSPQNAWYLFDPVTEYDAYDTRPSWRQIETPGGSSGSGRTGAIAFSVNNRGYFGLGRTELNQFLTDFYEFDPNSGTWGQMKEFPGSGRANAVAFPIDDQGFVGTGDNIVWSGETVVSGDSMSDFYRYDPFNNVWYPLADYTTNDVDNLVPKKVTRAVGFYSPSTDLGYIGFGYVVEGTDHMQQDIWYYRP